MLVHQISLNVARAAGVIDFTFEDLAPVCVFSRGADSVIAVRADSPWRSLEELIAYSQAHPHTVRWAANTGATTHWIAIAMLNAGAQLNVVAAGGSGERIPLLLGGHMDVIPIPLTMIEDHEALGTVRILATSSNERPPSRPDIPTMIESGVDVGFEYNNTFFMPRGTNPIIIERLNEAVRQVVQTNRAYQDHISGLGQVPVWMSTEDTQRLFRQELDALMAISHIIQGN
jgi:tripartite-type tricarboxylate transporter receptor subunit TctC